MNDDPYQPPYGQPPQQSDELPPTQYAPQQPSFGQPPPNEQPPVSDQPPQPPPYGQPTYGDVPPIPAPPPGYAAPPQQKKSRKWLWITLSIVASVFILACAACGSLFLYASLSGAGPSNVVQDYYKSVQTQDYATAYTYFAPGAAFVDPQSNQSIPIPSQRVYILTAQLLDRDLGTLTSYQASNGSDNNHINVNTVRGGKQYTTHLTMTQVDGRWKILNADGI